MRIFFFIIYILVSGTEFSHAQDLLENTGDENPNARPLTALFKSSRLVNGHTTETVSKNHLDFKIHHRFGKINEGLYEFFGLDKADMMLGLEYGISKNFTVGLLRNTYNKLYTGSVKYKFFQQTGKGKNSKPFTMTWYSNISINTLKWTVLGGANRQNLFTSRLSYVHQLLIARKFKKRLTLQIMPMLVHQNLVQYKEQPNDLWIAGLGFSYKLNGSVRFNMEYMPVINAFNKAGTTNALSAGLDIETGGHVFQLIVSNSRGMVENNIIPYTTGKWNKGDIYFGFNLLRFFKL